jgi:hypothetical protein
LTELTSDEALRLWDEDGRAKWPSGTDPTMEVNGRWLEEIASEAAGALSDVWGRTALRRARPRLYLDVRPRLHAVIPDLDAAIESVSGDGREYFVRLRDIVGWAIERPREEP